MPKLKKNKEEAQDLQPITLSLRGDPDPIATLSKFSPRAIEHIHSSRGYKLLHVAIWLNHLDLVEWLLQHHKTALLESRSPTGQTPLRYAILRKQPVHVELLCIHGARVNDFDANLRTSIDYALDILNSVRKAYSVAPSERLLLSETKLAQIIYLLMAFRENLPQHLVSQVLPGHKIIAYGKKACLPPYPVKDPQLLRDEEFLFEIWLKQNRFILQPIAQFSANIPWKYAFLKRAMMPATALGTLSFLIYLSLQQKSFQRNRFMLGMLGAILDCYLTEENFPTALDYFTARWIEYILLLKTRKIYDRLCWTEIKVKDFNWQSTAAIDDATYNPKHSKQGNHATTLAKQALQQARAQIHDYSEQQYSIIRKGLQHSIDSHLFPDTNNNFLGRESLASKCKRVLIKQPLANREQQYNRWCLLFNTQLRDTTNKKNVEGMVVVGTSDGRFEEYISLK